eukprot:983224-Amphidinium_carterae.3
MFALEQGLEALERHALLHVLAQDLCVCSVVVVTMFGIIVLAAACGIAFAQEALVETGSQRGVVVVLFPNVTTEQEKHRAEVAFDSVYEVRLLPHFETCGEQCAVCQAFNRSFNETAVRTVPVISGLAATPGFSAISQL